MTLPHQRGDRTVDSFVDPRTVRYGRDRRREQPGVTIWGIGLPQRLYVEAIAPFGGPIGPLYATDGPRAPVLCYKYFVRKRSTTQQESRYLKIKKSKAAPVFMAGLVAIAIGCGPANAAVPELPSSTSSTGIGSSVDRAITTKAKSYYIGPFKTGPKCREYASAQKKRGFKITRECRRHDDGKWWYMMSN